LMQVFISISLPEELQNVIFKIQGELKPYHENRISWVRPHLSHITLKFLGEVAENEIPDITNVLGEIALINSPIDLNITEIGGFPNVKNPRVLWLGVDGGNNLEGLRDQVESKINKLGFKKETKQFNPHLTLGRVKHLERGTKMIAKLTSINTPSIIWKATDIKLMSSQQTPRGVNYKTLTISKFGQSD